MRTYTESTTFRARSGLADGLARLSERTGLHAAVLIRAALKRAYPELAIADPLEALEALAPCGCNPVLPAQSIPTHTKPPLKLPGDTDLDSDDDVFAGCPSGWVDGATRPNKASTSPPPSPWPGEVEDAQDGKRRPARPAPGRLQEHANPAPKAAVRAFSAAYFEVEPHWALKTHTPSPKLLEQTAIAITEAGGITASIQGLARWAALERIDPAIERCFARSWWRLVQARVMSEDSPHFGKLYLTVFAENGWGGWTAQAEKERAQRAPGYAPWAEAQTEYPQQNAAPFVPLEVDCDERSAVRLAQSMTENERITASVWEEWMGNAARARAAHDRKHAGGVL